LLTLQTRSTRGSKLAILIEVVTGHLYKVAQYLSAAAISLKIAGAVVMAA
jgi:hypothetical protein